MDSKKFNEQPYWLQFLSLLASALLCMLFFSGSLLIFGKFFTSENMYDLLQNPAAHPSQMGLIKSFQLWATLGSFLLPALLFSYLKNNNLYSFINQERISYYLFYLIGLITALAAMPLIASLFEFNKQIPFPAALAKLYQAILTSEEAAQNITKAFLNVNTWPGLIFNILVIALAPAIAEEFFFRGAVQQLFVNWFKNKHVAIALAAALFSFIHFQFLGFLPRMFVGMLLGYLYFYSQNIWVSVFAHFVNNATQVILYFLFVKGYTSIDVDKVDSFGWPITMACTLIITGIFWLLAKKIFNPVINSDTEINY
jgi:membrane protease YdiL (CAAX protease family)